MIVSKLLELYFWFAISIFSHETLHLLAALKFKAKDINVKIGDSFFAIKLKKISISPLIIDGFVEVNRENMFEKETHKVVLFYLAGSIANVLLIICALIFMDKYLLKGEIIVINIWLIFTSLCPIFKNNDINGILSFLKHKHQ